MPQAAQVEPLYGFVELYSVLEEWSRCAFCQAAFNTNRYLSKKPLTGVFSSLEASFPLLLNKALNHIHQKDLVLFCCKTGPSVGLVGTSLERFLFARIPLLRLTIYVAYTGIVFLYKKIQFEQLQQRRMEGYKIIKEVGDGTFGTVWRAIKKQSGEVVAIKKMKKKYYSWEECMNLREVKSLRRMNHPNIVKLKEVIRENDVLYFVFEYMEHNLYELIKDRAKLFSETEVRNWCFQIFQALAYMHQKGYFHRDLKPENFLVTKDSVKIADFGLAREICSQPPYTEYVSTRWYRAPEVLLQSYMYGSAVDMWAMGAIMAEMFTLHPLFPGKSEADQIFKICSVIGTPDCNSWADGRQLADDLKYQFPQLTSVNLSVRIPSASNDAVDLISSLCSWDPSRRPKAGEVLQHSFFQPCYYIPPYLRSRPTALSNTPLSVGTKGTLEQKGVKKYSTGLLSNPKLANNILPAKMDTSLKPGLQKKLEMGLHEPERNYRSLKNSVNQTVTGLQKKLEIGLHEPDRNYRSLKNSVNQTVTGLQKKLEMGLHEPERNYRSLKNSVNQTRYQLPVRNSPGFRGRNSYVNGRTAPTWKSSGEVVDVAEKMAKMSVSSGMARATRAPPPLKAGRWHRHTDTIEHPGSYPRKAGD